MLRENNIGVLILNGRGLIYSNFGDGIIEQVGTVCVSIGIARPVFANSFSRTVVPEQLFPDHITEYQSWNVIIMKLNGMVSWMQLVTSSIICL